MKRMMIGLLFATLATNAFAFYNPGQGRWLSRDPIGEPGFDGNKYVSLKPEDIHRLDSADLDEEELAVRIDDVVRALSATPYVMVHNDPVSNIDLYGLICGVVANRTRAPLSSGINAGHEWLEYAGTSVGFWPNRGYVVLRPDPGQTTPFPIYWQWGTEKKKSGTLKWGPAAGKSCACVTCDEIIASLDAAPNPGWHSFPIRNNCRRFVKWALAGSCLKKGKKTSSP